MGRPPSCLCGACEKCKHRLYMRDWYSRKDPDYAAEQSRKHRARARDYERGKWHSDPELFKRRKAARNALNQVIARGNMERGACEVCGAPEAQAHHEDYSRPYDVVWLCDLHHRATHGEHTVLARTEEA